MDIVTGKIPVQTSYDKPEEFEAALEKFNNNDFKERRITYY